MNRAIKEIIDKRKSFFDGDTMMKKVFVVSNVLSFMTVIYGGNLSSIPRRSLDRDLKAALAASRRRRDREQNDDFKTAVVASLQSQKEFNAKKQAEMRKVQRNLPEGRVLFDVPGQGRCGYYASLAIQFVKNHPNESVVIISKENLIQCLRSLVILIRQTIQSNDPEAREDSENLQAILLADGEYVDRGQIAWQNYFEDIQRGKVQVDDMLLKFVRKALLLPEDVVIIKDNDENALKKISSNGTLIHIGVDHFMVALPRKTRNGIAIQEVRCQELDGRWWSSQVEKPVIPETDSETDSETNLSFGRRVLNKIWNFFNKRLVYFG
jgi:hypothetical protein